MGGEKGDCSMIQVNLDLDTGLATPALALTIKAGAKVPVRIFTFRNGTPSAPGGSPGFALALSGQTDPQAVVAWLADFSRENAHEFSGTLDANDTRLISLLTGKTTTTLNAELQWTDASGQRITPNFTVTCQPPISDGPESTEGGPVYYTAAQTDSMIAAAVVAAREVIDGGEV
jgi:hypothetical protein